MATKEDDVPEGKVTICGNCKEKFKTLCKGFAEEWSNNFKMCFCPWKSKTYDIDSDPETSDQPQPQQHEEQGMTATAQDDHKEQVTKFTKWLLVKEVH